MRPASATRSYSPPAALPDCRAASPTSRTRARPSGSAAGRRTGRGRSPSSPSRSSSSRDGLLALLELDLAQLRVGLGARPAGLDLGLALVQLALPVGDRLLGLAEPLLAPLDAGALRLEQRLRARDLGLAGGELAAEVVEPALPRPRGARRSARRPPRGAPATRAGSARPRARRARSPSPRPRRAWRSSPRRPRRCRSAPRRAARDRPSAGRPSPSARPRATRDAPRGRSRSRAP